MSDLAGLNGPVFAGHPRLPADISNMAEPELSRWAEQKTVDANSDTPVVRFGAIAFWAVVAALLLARIFLIDPADLRPTAAATGLTNSPIQVTSNSAKL